jgi:hypothetical protein
MQAHDGRFGLVEEKGANQTRCCLDLTAAHSDKISQFPIVGERPPSAVLMLDRQTQRMVALNPMRLAGFRR